MINGVHVVLYSHDAEADRAFFKNVLRWPYADAGEGWLIFRAPPAETAVHPSPEGAEHGEMMLMCDDLEETVADLKMSGVPITQPIKELKWGKVTAIHLPGGGELSLYEPLHPRPTGE
ncbi:VOC family protein [Salininema proteolyticum]|uniref:VOC family protein n=1 Tax=Salininema proteolyticum TaxID=1607685 RepID=A0ABV8TVV6_9ACTN